MTINLFQAFWQSKMWNATTKLIIDKASNIIETN